MMRFLKFAKRLLIVCAVAVTLLLALAMLWPWKPFVGGRLAAMLQAGGLQNPRLTVTDMGLTGIALKDIAFGAQGIAVAARDLALEGAPGADYRQWRGKWRIADIVIEGLGLPIAVLNGGGTLTADAERLALDGKLASADHAWQAEFNVDQIFAAPEKSRLNIVRAAMPWNGGKVSAHDVALPLGGQKRDLTIDLQVEKISLDALLQQLTGNRASAQGLVSGALPVTLKADGAILVDEGKLQAIQPGTIAIAPEVIPGDNEQIALVRDVLKDLHYSYLTIGMNSDKEGKLSALLTVEGSNPAVDNGRAVKLNVHLTGDVLSFVQQSLIPLSDPGKLMQQGRNAKP
ncbi:MAG: YdbH domain-containing protein [Alphaproteobacteria bacterium]